MFKKKPPVEKFAVIDASREAPPLSIGVVISRHARILDAILAQMEFDAGQTNPRSRIVRLNRLVPEGSPIDPRQDLAPETGSE